MRARTRGAARPVRADRVTDTGRGMDAGDVWRARSSPSSPPRTIGKGTGLGLSMVYGFVKQSGGHVKIYSRAGPGHDGEALPAAPARPPTRRPRAAEEAPRSRPPGASETILVCRGRRRRARLLGRGAARAGLPRAGGGGRRRGARPARAHDGRVDLLFTDVVLPGGMTGAAARRAGAGAAARTSRCCSRPAMRATRSPGRPAGPGRRADHQALHLRRPRHPRPRPARPARRPADDIKKRPRGRWNLRSWTNLGPEALPGGGGG